MPRASGRARPALLALLAIGALACGGSKARPSEPVACEDLTGMSIGDAVDLVATVVPTAGSQPAYCRVRAVVPPKMHFEVRLPTSWTGRLLFIGGGGLNGVVLPPEIVLFQPPVTARGYVTITTDSGHQGSPFDGSWALDDPLAMENYGYLSTHDVLAAAREIVRAHYGRAARWSYFIGSSTGGREGLISAQRWPGDFDGIVSLEPVYDLMVLFLAELRLAQRVFTVPGARLSEAKLRTLANGALAACDGIDGIEDALISNVFACSFDPASLRCAGADADDCLTDAEIETAQLVRSEMELGFTLHDGIHSYPPWPVGHEDHPGSWPSWIVGTSTDPATSSGFVLSNQAVKYFVTKDPDFDSLQFTPGPWAEPIRAIAAVTHATDPDLSEFASRGGKLILWHGLADYGVSAFSTVRYYDGVVATMGQRRTDRFLRFYLSPGVDHLNGGPGAGTTDFLTALESWVEEGEAPGDLVSYRGSTQTFSRPLCRYPTYPRYSGNGDPDSAASFFCSTPGTNG